MLRWFLAAAALLCAATLVWMFRSQRLRRIARERLHEEVEQAPQARIATVSPALRRYLWVPWAVGLCVFAIIRFWVGLDSIYAVALAVIVGVMASIVEGWRYAKVCLQLEAQLADAIDLMVAALSAGSGIMDAIDSATNEARPPLKAELQEVLGRIRLGDKPRFVFEDLSKRLPLEAFRLFAFTLAVHGETGGSLAPTLSTVGRTIRDRIEIGRRVRSQSTQAQASVIGIVCISYFLGLLMWRTNPATFEEFLTHPMGMNITAVAIVLQAIGMLWITRLAQMKY